MQASGTQASGNASSRHLRDTGCCVWTCWRIVNMEVMFVEMFKMGVGWNRTLETAEVVKLGGIG